MAHRAVISDIAELVKVLERDTTACLFFVQECFNKQGCRQNLVARAVQQICARYMRRTHRFALSATQAVLDRIRNFPDFALFQYQAFLLQQAEAGRVCAIKICTFEQLAFVETPFRVYSLFVLRETSNGIITEIIEFGNANTVLPRNHAIERSCQLHDSRHRLIGLLEHRIIVRVDRDIGMHIAITGMHMQGDKQPAFQNALMGCVDVRANRIKRPPIKQLHKRLTRFGFPGHAQAVTLQRPEH